MQGKTKLCYGMNLDFYELTKKDLKNLDFYLNETVMYDGKWFVVKIKSKLFKTKDEMNNYPENWIKYPYQNKKPIK
jgi:hypothetical protein